VASTATSFGLGRLLSRIYWDSAGDINDQTGFWDSHSADGVIRIHQFMTDTMATRNYVVGLETMRPDEQPRTAPEVTRIISIQGPPPPAFDSVHVGGPRTVKPNQTSCEWETYTYGGQSPFNYRWYLRIGTSWKLIGLDRILDWQVGTSSFTIKGEAADAAQRTRSETVAVTVTPSGATCYYRPGHGG
jgi:hypothetical protein